MNEGKQVRLPAFRVAGPTVRTKNEFEMSGDAGRIGPLWGSFMQLAPQAIPGVVEPDTIYSVYTAYESDHNGAYDVILGRSVAEGIGLPAGMKLVEIGAGPYLIFPAADPSPDAIRAAWGRVYEHFDASPGRAFTADFEKYSAHGVELYIAILS